MSAPPHTEAGLAGPTWLLRAVLGTGLVVAGADKFFDKLAVWSMYLSPAAERLLPVSGPAFLHLVGPLEVAIGLALLTRWPRLGAYAMAAWLACIAVNLALAGSFWDLMVRDLEIATSAFVLGRLVAWQEASHPARSPRADHGEGATWAHGAPETRKSP